MSAFVINPYAFAGATFEFAYLDVYTDVNNLTTYTFNNVDFGVADANRHIIVAVMARSGGSLEVSSATIGGVSATIDAKTAAQLNHSAIVRANVTSGTSGTVSVTFSAGSLRAAIGVYRVVANALVVSDADTAAGGASANVTLDTGAGCVIAAAADNQATISWTNVTEDAGGNLEVLTYSSASAATTAGSLTVTVTSTNNVRLAAVSYS